ncbi:gram-negative bacteria-binding protein 1 [Scaptodrosophila lebanonensis]|uniref:Gram-negative bacteria-binding protein 1 n=1 Tax=Drosophila lebanonensis TaxID=7225 RepID=A0A6J2TL88_DROLE|nr:gram-negative bacteria-binding protein 1 [Scaptodrosophila lebanonensis]
MQGEAMVMMLLAACICHSWSYKVPNVRVKLLEDGFRVAIPDETGVKSVAFNVNRNRNFTSFAQGEFSMQVRSPKDGLWMHDFLHNELRAHDTLYIWTSVQHERAIFRDISEPKQVCQLSGSSILEGCSFSVGKPLPATDQTAETATTPVTTSTTTTLAPCEPSLTEVSPVRSTSICKGQLIFEEHFEQLNESRWLHEVRAPLDTNDAEFVLYDGKASIQHGNLVIKPRLWSDYRPDLKVSSASLDLAERCSGTHNRQKECVLHTSGPIIMPPVVVPRLSTKESFAFKYGRIEIRAKLPKGDWLMPLLLLEPLMEWYGQTGYESGQLRIAFARGNTQLRQPHGKILDGRILYGGAVLSTEAAQREDFMVNQRRNEHYGNEFHVYGLEWSSEHLQFTVNGQPYGELLSGFVESDINPRWRRGGPMAPFDRLFYITLGISVGGFGDFVDNLRTASYAKPWTNKHPQARLHFWQEQNKWLPTWEHPELLVDYVRVYAI